MKRLTLTMMLVAAATVVVAQEPPVRPAPVRPPAEPGPTPRAAIAPRAAPLPPMWHGDLEEMRLHAAEVARMGREMHLDASRVALDEVRANSVAIAAAAREASREMNRTAISEAVAASAAWRDQAVEVARAAEAFRPFAQGVPARAPMVPMGPMEPMGPMMLNRVGDDLRVPLPLFRGEPEDSLYRLAHDFLGRGDYGRAAQMFKDIGQKYPKSVYQNDLSYYEAFARYRIGTTEELQSAAKLLEPRAAKLVGTTSPSGSVSYTSYGGNGPGFFNTRRSSSDSDVVGLYIRINSTLAQRGNRAAADVVAKAAQAGANTCDRDDMQIRAEALNALSQMDPAAALPKIRDVLQKKDECSIGLRQRAVFMLGRRSDAEAANLLGVTAKSDPSTDVRTEAIGWLPKLQGDAGVNMLEELLRTEQDERIQRAIVKTLTSSDNQKARSSMRTLIDRKDAPIGLRVEAINSFNSDHATADDAAYLRALYGRADNDRIKDAVISALSRIGGQENDQWVLNIAKNPSESSQLRATAMSRLIRSNISISELSKLYDASDALSIRQQIVNIFERRSEPEAADKLVDIVRNSTILSIRTQALRALGNKKDPRSAQLYINILDGKAP